jgi:hypothetical protein
MLKKILSLLIFLILTFLLIFSVYPGPGEEPDTEGHPWSDSQGTIEPVPEEHVRLIFVWNFNPVPHFTFMFLKDYQTPSQQYQKVTKREVSKGKDEISQRIKDLRKEIK